MRLPHFSALLLVSLSAYSHGDTYTWLGGGVNNNTTTEANWSSNTAPPHGQGVGTGAAVWDFFSEQSRSPYLVSDTKLGSIEFSSRLSYSLGGASRTISLNETILNDGGGTATLAPSISVNGGSASISATNGYIVLNGGVATNNKDLVLNADESQTLTINGVLSGGYLPNYGGVGLTKNGTGTLALAGNNTFSAPLNVTAGTLSLLDDNALSPNIESLSIAEDSTLVVGDGVSISDRPVTLAGTLDFEGTSDWSFEDGLELVGVVVTSEDVPARVVLSASGTSGTLDSTDPIVYTGGGYLELKAKTGATLKIDGELNIDPDGSYTKVQVGDDGSEYEGTVEINNGINRYPGSNGSLYSIIVKSGTLRLGIGEYDEFFRFSLFEDGHVDIKNGHVSIPRLSGSGDMTVGVSGLTIFQDMDETYSGDIQGNEGSRVTKKGDSVLTVQGQLNPSSIIIEEGELKLDDGQLHATTGLSHETEVSGTGVLSGVGQVDDLRISSGGVLRPGANEVGVMVADRVFLESGGIVEWSPDSWVGSAGVGWPTVSANSTTINATSSSRTVIRIDTDAISDFIDGNAKFVILSGSLTGFDADKFEIEDLSDSPLEGSWSVVDDASTSGLALKYTSADPYLAWINDHGYTGAEAEYAADPDGDGLVNGIEFVLGSAPSSDDGQSLPVPTVEDVNGSDHLCFTFTRTDESAYTSPTGMVSVDLSLWVPMYSVTGYIINETDLGNGKTEVKQYIPYDPQTTPKLFTRLEASAEPNDE